MRWTLAAILALALVTSSAAASAPRLVIEHNFPDPDITEVSGVYYAYATSSQDRNIQLETAADLAGPWNRRPDVLPTAKLPPWIGRDSSGNPRIWAPDVTRREDGEFLLYYSALHAPSRRHCIGAAIADTPEGPFTPTAAEPLICGRGGEEIIDPASFVDTDGRRYLLYKAAVRGHPRGGPASIMIREVAADGLTPVGPDVVLLRANRPEEAGVVEAPTLVRRPTGYVLFFSANEFNSGAYFTNYATSRQVTGDYTKGPGSVLSKEAFDGELTNPGGQDVVSRPYERDRIVFHGDLAAPGGPRGMFVADLRWKGLRPGLNN